MTAHGRGSSAASCSLPSSASFIFCHLDISRGSILHTPDWTWRTRRESETARQIGRGRVRDLNPLLPRDAQPSVLSSSQLSFSVWIYITTCEPPIPSFSSHRCSLISTPANRVFPSRTQHLQPCHLVRSRRPSRPRGRARLPCPPLPPSPTPPPTRAHTLPSRCPPRSTRLRLLRTNPRLCHPRSLPDPPVLGTQPQRLSPRQQYASAARQSLPSVPHRFPL